MNEASSKYVDQIATEKLIQEKLSRVHHAPNGAYPSELVSLNDFNCLPKLPETVVERQDGKNLLLSFSSAVVTSDTDNNLVQCIAYLSEESRGALVFLHGLFEDNLQIYNFFISLLKEQGLDVYLMMLPYHYNRMPAGSVFSGEFFFSGNLLRSALAYKQAVYDLYQLQQWVSQRSGRPAWIVGFSMGGGITLTLAALTGLPGVFAVNPVCNISRLVWTSALFAPIRQDLEGSGIGLGRIEMHYAAFEPLNADPIRTDLAHIVLGRSLYDQINDPANYDLLVENWKLQNVIPYKAGHLNVLRAPRLAMDVVSAIAGKNPSEVSMMHRFEGEPD
jgi:hypothetical protein